MTKNLLVGMVAACAVLSGCGKQASEKVTEKIIEHSLAKDGVQSDVKITDDKMTIQNKDGALTFAGGSSVAVPDTFPKDVLVYDGAKVVSAMTMPEGCNLSLQTTDKPDKIIGAYKTRMTAEGWKEEASVNTAQHSMVSFKKEDRTTTVMAMGSEDKTQILLTVEQPKKKNTEGE